MELAEQLAAGTSKTAAAAFKSPAEPHSGEAGAGMAAGRERPARQRSVWSVEFGAQWQWSGGTPL